MGKLAGCSGLRGLFRRKKKLVEEIAGWVEADRDQPSAWGFGDDAVFVGRASPELEQWFIWRNAKTAVLPTEWRRQPLKQMVINRTLDYVEHTMRLKNTKDFPWTQEFNGTQFGLVGWIDGDN